MSIFIMNYGLGSKYDQMLNVMEYLNSGTQKPYLDTFPNQLNFAH